MEKLSTEGCEVNDTSATLDGLVVRIDDGIPRIRDVDLAERLNYASPYKIRELIQRLISSEKLQEVRVFPAVGKTSGGRPTSEFWLTESQALKVAAKSETDVADAVLDTVIQVFIAARQGLLKQESPCEADPIWQRALALDIIGPDVHPSVIAAMKKCDAKWGVFDWVFMAKGVAEDIERAEKLAVSIPRVGKVAS